MNKIADVTTKVDDVIRDNPWMDPEQIEHRMDKLARENMNAKAKRRKVIAIANEITAALAPHAACKPGCSQCCHMNTMIYEHEAIRLAEVSGRKRVRLPHRPLRQVYLDGNKFNNRPCPFLVDDKCSVYEDRPLVCRTHHSLHHDASLCDMSISAHEQVRPLMYNPDLVEIPYRTISEAHSAREPSGNIWEYFPGDDVGA